MSGLQIALSLIGVLLILAIIGHGMWTIRNNDKAVSKQQQELARKRQQRDAEGFDADGIGSVRVVQEVPATTRRRAEPETQSAAMPTTDATTDFSPPKAPAAEPADELDLPEAMVTESRKAEANTQATNTQKASPRELSTPEPMVPEPTIPRPSAPSAPSSASSSASPSASLSASVKPNTSAAAPEQIGLGIDEVTEVEGVTTAPDEVIVLHVKGDIQGAVLLQQMTELGFKYGDFDIFHRHETTAGTGPVLFSLANMFNPGTFDIDAMETFKTEGLALFLALPVKGSAQQAFTMMHNAAQKIATAIGGGQVLDEHRNPLTRQTVQHIVQRIREYERRQLLRQHGG